jgi:hypothetical protein
MAENINALILPIGADATQFERSINDVKSAFKELSATIAATPFNLVTDKQKLQLNALKETLTVLTTDVKTFGQAIKIPENSILGLTQRIAELNKKKINLDAKTSASEIARLNKEIEKLTTQKNNIDALGRSISEIGTISQTAFSKVQDTSKGARTALTSVSLVAQDLPFGFIAIQNNIPALIQSFGQLQNTAGGTKGALAQLGSALIGPAGVFLAFSVVTSIITVAVQKYGSLGAALDALITKQSRYSEEILEANKSYKKFNKEKRDSIEISSEEVASIQGSIAKVSALGSIVGDLTKSYNERNSALNDLKSIDKDRFGNLDIEKTKLEDLTTAVDNYIISIKQAAITKGFEGAIGETSVELAKQVKLLNTLKADLDLARKKPLKFIGKEDRIDTSEVDIANKAFLAQDIIVKALRGEIALYNTEIDKSVKAQNTLQAPIDAANKAFEEQQKKLKNAAKEAKASGKNQFTLALDPQDLDAAFNLDSIISSIIKYGNALLDTNKSVEERKNALKELVAINPQVFTGLSIEKSATLANKDAIESYLRSLEVLKKEKEFSARASQINAEFLKAEIKSQDAAVKAEKDAFDSLVKLTYAQDEYGNSTDKITEKSLAFLKVLKQQQDITAAINKGLNNIYGLGTAEENDPVKRIEDLSKRIKQAKENFENTIRRGLQQPFEDFFSTLIETGKFSLDSFEGLFKDMLKRIAAQIISAGIAKLISSILFPPGAAAGALAGAAAGNSAGGGIIGALVSLFGGRRSAFNNVNFGGVEGGGMQMAGAVNLTLRGSDLVGSINRTNSTINRVG